MVNTRRFSDIQALERTKDQKIKELEKELAETKERLASKEAAQVTEMGIGASRVECLMEQLRPLFKGENETSWQKYYDEFVDRAMLRWVEGTERLKEKYPNGVPADASDAEIYLEELIIDPEGVKAWEARRPQEIQGIKRWMELNPDETEEIRRMVFCRNFEEMQRRKEIEEEAGKDIADHK